MCLENIHRVNYKLINDKIKKNAKYDTIFKTVDIQNDTILKPEFLKEKKF